MTMKDQKMEGKKNHLGKYSLALYSIIYLSEWVLDYTNQRAFWKLFFTPSLGNGIIKENFVESTFIQNKVLMFEIDMNLFSNVHEKGKFSLNNILYYIIVNISILYLLW